MGSARDWPDDFTDRLTAPLPGPRQMLRVMRTGGMRPDLSRGGRIPVRREPLPRSGDDEVAVTWVGHASLVVQIGGLIVLTDPVWSRRLPGVRQRLTAPGVVLGDLPRIDAVVISHNHYDHLDAPTIRRLPRATPVLVPAKLAPWFQRRGFTDVTELDWWESRAIGDVTFDFVPAHHWSRRGPADGCRTLWGGWVLTSPHEQRVYFAGDTGYGHWFAEIAARYPGVDIALLPIGAYTPRWFLKDVHMNPEEAVRACDDLGAAAMVPMHWGTFLLSAEPPLEPLDRVRAAWVAAGRDRDALWDLPIGATGTLTPIHPAEPAAA